MRSLWLVLALLLATVARAERFEASWRLAYPDNARGFSAVFLPKGLVAAPLDDPAEPNLSGLFAIGFDTSNPPPKGDRREIWFGPLGNIENRPQREISLHRDRRERANRLSPVEMADGQTHTYTVVLEFVTGGADVTVAIDGTPIYDHYFVPELMANQQRLVLLGASNAEALTSRWSGKASRRVAPVKVRAFDQALNDAGHHRVTQTVDFAAVPAQVGRVVATLTLAPTPKGIDPWDRLAQLTLTDENGERFELLRWITPYRKGWEWQVDLTDFLPLLRGRKSLELFCETYSEGWLVTIDFDFYPGRPAREPYRVVNLWNGRAEIGLASKPIEKFLTAQRIATDPETIGAKFRAVVTGHGGSPNTDNAGEFWPLWRKLHCDGRVFTNLLWKTDVYLNPCRPQGGTWKFPRAGWAPGDVVAPWEVELTPFVRPGKPLRLGYELQPYVNRTPEPGFPANHTFASQLILYRKPR